MKLLIWLRTFADVYVEIAILIAVLYVAGAALLATYGFTDNRWLFIPFGVMCIPPITFLIFQIQAVRKSRQVEWDRQYRIEAEKARAEQSQVTDLLTPSEGRKEKRS